MHFSPVNLNDDDDKNTTRTETNPGLHLLGTVTGYEAGHCRRTRTTLWHEWLDSVVRGLKQSSEGRR